MYAYLITVVGSAAAAGLLVWQLVANHYQLEIANMKLAYQTAAHEQVLKAMKEQTQLQEKKDEAIKQAEARAARNAAAATAARTDADGLRADLASTRSKLSNAPVDAVRVYASALSDVFDQCVRKYQDVAQDADRAISDLQTLKDAWPKQLSTLQKP